MDRDRAGVDRGVGAVEFTFLTFAFQDYCCSVPISQLPVTSVNAFHEKAGRSQVGSSWFWLVSCFSQPSRHCRHPSIRTLNVSDSSLGASWVFSFQPVLPPVYRPCLPSRGWKLGQAFNAVTGTRRWALSFPSHSTRLLPAWVGGYFARVRRSLRSPTTDAARPLAFEPPR